jgi:hypothetical protein
MSEAEIIHDVEVIGTELEPASGGTLFHTNDPGEIIDRATAIADKLATVLRDRKLTSNISGKEHVRVEGWTLLGTMLGVFPFVEWVHKLEDGYEARVVAKTLAGQEVGAAEAVCLRSERAWANRDEYALKSMAQTRAVSKALRGPLGFVVTLAGYEATPAEEMPSEGFTVSRTQDPRESASPSTWPKLTEAISVWDETTHDLFGEFVKATARLLFGPTVDIKKLSASDKKFLLQKAAGASVHLRERFDPNTLPYPAVADIRAAFAEVLDGQELALPSETTEPQA